MNSVLSVKIVALLIGISGILGSLLVVEQHRAKATDQMLAVQQQQLAVQKADELRQGEAARTKEMQERARADAALMEQLRLERAVRHAADAHINFRSPATENQRIP